MYDKAQDECPNNLDNGLGENNLLGGMRAKVYALHGIIGAKKRLL